MAGVETKHPDWSDRAPEWKIMRDCVRGEKLVKEQGETYLPKPSGFTKHSDGGTAAYDAYRLRSQFPEITGPSVQGMVGIIHRTEAKIDLPPGMESILEKATKDGLSMEAFHQRITTELLINARYCLLVDAGTEGKSDTPWLAGYSAESLINWSEDRTMFVLDESGLKLDGFDWVQKDQFRVLRLENGIYSQDLHEGKTDNFTKISVNKMGGGTLDEIPFVVIGASDLALAPEEPPLMGVSRAAIAIYQLTADYRWQLFMSGQETLIIINGDAPDVVGAGVIVALKGEQSSMGTFATPDAKYVGPSGNGIEAHRQAIVDQKEVAAAAGAKMFDTDTNAAESGDALKIRFAAQTATLVSVARASAQGLEKALKYVAVLMGKDPNKVVVTPNLSFIDSTLTPEQANALVKVWQSGAISYVTLYENLQRGEIASNERTHEEEQELIADEGESLGMMGRNVDPSLIPAPPGEETETDPAAPKKAAGAPVAA